MEKNNKYIYIVGVVCASTLLVGIIISMIMAIRANNRGSERIPYYEIKIQNNLDSLAHSIEDRLTGIQESIGSIANKKGEQTVKVICQCPVGTKEE